MALKNYLTSGTYTEIDNIIYEKPTKRCSVGLVIWADSSKTVALANKGISVEGYSKQPLLFSLTNKLKSIPENTSPEMFYIIDESPEGELSGYAGQITKFNSVTKNWDKWVLWEGFLGFVEDEKKYYQFQENKWIEVKNMTVDSRIWEKWFAPHIAFAEGTNPTKQMYEFMKTLEQFKDCEDV